MKQKSFTRGYLPHNFLAEKMLLSCLLIEPKLVETIFSKLPVEAFYFKNHQELYKALRYIINQKLPIDTLKISTLLQTEGFINKIGGTQVLLELINQVPDLIYFEEYIQAVNEKFLRRSLIRIAYEIIEVSYVTNISSEKILRKAEAELFLLTNQTLSIKRTNNAQLVSNVFSEIKEKFLKPKLPGLTSGFKTLDSITQGFQKSDLIVIAGRPSTGKTALSLTISLNIIKSERLPILFFSLEMSKEQIMYRLLAMESDVDSDKLRTGKLQKNDWTKLHRTTKIFSKLPFFIEDSPTISVQELRSKIKTVISEQGQIGLVLIDYLQLVQTSTGQFGTRTEELAQVTRGLKNLAREFKVPIIFLSQLSRSVETRINKTPILSDLRESGSIEQDADLVLMLSNVETKVINSHSMGTQRLVKLIIAKHRNGPTGTITLKFNGKQTKFFETLKSECPEPESNW